jgi:aminoglycoside 6'-N-acetyltransferase I
MAKVEITPLNSNNQEMIRQAAHLLVIGFAGMSPTSWPTIDAGLEEMAEAQEPGRICLVAVDEVGTVLGWVGGIPEYDGHAWELHPLVVHPDYWGQGIGRALVVALEEQVRAQGATTIFLGTDDEMNLTSLSNRDLYPDLWTHIRDIQSSNRHPYAFYQKCGYTIYGILPDANGPGKPDILMAKRLVEVDYSKTPQD